MKKYSKRHIPYMCYLFCSSKGYTSVNCKSNPVDCANNVVDLLNYPVCSTNIVIDSDVLSCLQCQFDAHLTKVLVMKG